MLRTAAAEAAAGGQELLGAVPGACCSVGVELTALPLPAAVAAAAVHAAASSADVAAAAWLLLAVAMPVLLLMGLGCEACWIQNCRLLLCCCNSEAGLPARSSCLLSASGWIEQLQRPLHALAQVQLHEQPLVHRHMAE